MVDFETYKRNGHREIAKRRNQALTLFGVGVVCLWAALNKAAQCASRQGMLGADIAYNDVGLWEEGQKRMDAIKEDD